MSMTLTIPFTEYSTSLGGHTVGERRVDPTTGYEYRLVQAGTALTNDAFASGEVVTVKTAPYVGTNDVSTALEATYPMPLGIAMSACPESTATTTYYFWVMRNGYHATVKTDAGDDIALGELLFADETVDGAVDRIADNTTITDRLLRGLVGRAAAADSATAVAAYIFCAI